MQERIEDKIQKNINSEDLARVIINFSLWLCYNVDETQYREFFKSPKVREEEKENE